MRDTIEARGQLEALLLTIGAKNDASFRNSQQQL